MRTRRNDSSSKLGIERLEGPRCSQRLCRQATAGVDSVELTECYIAGADFPMESDVQMDIAEENAVEPAEDLAQNLPVPITIELMKLIYRGRSRSKAVKLKRRRRNLMRRQKRLSSPTAGAVRWHGWILWLP